VATVAAKRQTPGAQPRALEAGVAAATRAGGG
jgi:hypothetical protein